MLLLSLLLVVTLSCLHAENSNQADIHNITVIENADSPQTDAHHSTVSSLSTAATKGLENASNPNNTSSIAGKLTDITTVVTSTSASTERDQMSTLAVINTTIKAHTQSLQLPTYDNQPIETSLNASVEQATSTRTYEELIQKSNEFHRNEQNTMTTTLTPEEFLKWLNNVHDSEQISIPSNERHTASVLSTLRSTNIDEPKNPTEFLKWLDSIHPQAAAEMKTFSEDTTIGQTTTGLLSDVSTQNPIKESQSNLPEVSETSTRLSSTHSPQNYIEEDSPQHSHSDLMDFTNDNENHTHVDLDHMQFKPERMPPMMFLEWLNSIHPDKNTTSGKVVPAKNVVDTSIITTEKLIIVISTICGTFVLFVVILVIVSCCRRRQNVRSDSEKSDFSVTSAMSAVSVGSAVSTISEKQGVDFTTKTGCTGNDLFMGIPPNNKIWKELEQLPPTASSVLPESTRM